MLMNRFHGAVRLLMAAVLTAALAVALGCGLLVGIERERRKGSGPNRGFAGLRTFAVTSVVGAAAALTQITGLVITGAALGNLLSEVLADPRVRLFGMSWGGTLNIATRFVAALERPDLEVISVMGGLTRGSDLNSFEITTRLADLLGAQHSYFTAPLYAGSAESRDTIMQLDVFRDILERILTNDRIDLPATAQRRELAATEAPTRRQTAALEAVFGPHRHLDEGGYEIGLPLRR